MRYEVKGDHMAQRHNSADDVSYTIEVIVLALLGVLLAAGFGVMALTGPSAGTMTGYNAGLTMIVMASVMGVGAGAIQYHRMHDRKLVRVQETQEKMQEDIRTLMVLLTARNNATADQLSSRRAGKN